MRRRGAVKVFLLLKGHLWCCLRILTDKSLCCASATWKRISAFDLCSSTFRTGSCSLDLDLIVLIVDELMSLESVAAEKALVTGLTFVWSFFFMTPDMTLQMFDTSKRPLALIALIPMIWSGVLSTCSLRCRDFDRVFHRRNCRALQSSQTVVASSKSVYAKRTRLNRLANRCRHVSRKNRLFPRFSSDAGNANCGRSRGYLYEVRPAPF